MSEAESTPQARTRNVGGRIARSIVDRATHQGWKGKKGDDLAVEAAVGAVMGCIAACGENSPEANAASMLAFIISTRGLDYAKERAAAYDAWKASGGSDQ